MLLELIKAVLGLLLELITSPFDMIEALIEQLGPFVRDALDTDAKTFRAVLLLCTITACTVTVIAALAVLL